MDSKKATYCALVFIMLLDLVYFININSSSSGMRNQNGMGPEYFPNILAILLFVLCIFSIVDTFRKEGKKITVSNLKYILFTIFFTALFILSWQVIGMFYLQCFLYLAILFTVYRWNVGQRSVTLLINFSISLFVTVSIWAVFGLIMNFSF
ncbi:tripartite tricarboxylate transporter TctB family protein [Radiobacillus sp. PE A8.2]|uniref:tripartite tricarboxylate transporter TctB family protein n=1 Tax=Radiobacillus sp. PE A8.2 TaxID=3380349 RepID=UPI00388CFB4D